jgi:signal transduction histidine kinase
MPSFLVREMFLLICYFCEIERMQKLVNISFKLNPQSGMVYLFFFVFFFSHYFQAQNSVSDPNTVLSESFKKKLNYGLSLPSNPSQLSGKRYYDLGVESYSNNDYLAALKFWQTAYISYSQSGDYINQGRTMLNIANVYFQIQDAQNYKQFTKNALAIFTEINDTVNIAVCYINLGNYAHIRDKFDEALGYYKKALKAFTSEDQIVNHLTCLGNIGGVYSDMAQFELGRQYLEEAELIAKSIGDKQFLSRNSYNIAFIYFEQKDYQSCIKLLEQAIVYGKEVNNYHYLALAYKKLADCYTALGNYKQANQFLVLHNDYRDSLLSLEKSKQFNLAEIKFNKKIDENRIELLELEKKQNELLILKEKDRSKVLSLFLVLLALLGIIIFISAMFWFKNRQKNIMIEQRQLLQRNHMDAILKSQEDERKKLARDLHDSVGQKLTGLLFKTNEALHNEKTEAEEKKQLQVIKSLAEDCYAEVRTISHQMMPRAIQESSLVDLLNDLLQSTFKNTSIQYFLHSNIHEDYEDKIKLSIYRICQELINNILKHAKACKEVQVSLIQNSQTLIIMVENDGDSITIENIAASSNGIGIQNIHARLDLIQGKIFFESGEFGGLRAIIRVNLNPTENV